MTTMQLTPAQQRILDDVTRDGERVYNGRARKSIEKLVTARLVVAHWDSIPQAKGNGMELVERITVRPRPIDRVTTKELKIPRRTVIEPGTELSLVRGSVQGIRGRVSFIGYTKTNGGKEWAEVLDSKGRSRLIDPTNIKTVHRKKSR